MSVIAGIVVLFVGKVLNERLAVLREYNIPEPVTEGSSSRLRSAW
jgi:glutamate:Na+ symporter, ESS family